MKENKRRLKIILVLLLILLTTGCTRTLTDKENRAVKNESTGQTLTKNILCKPTNAKTIKIYKKYKVNIDKLPECKNFKLNSGKYEGLWTGIFVKPLASLLIWIGKTVGNYAISIIIVSLMIRLIIFPLTRKTALQSEKIKKAQPEIDRVQKKFANKQDQESMMKQQEEILMVYKKYKINPLSGCLFAFIQLPLFLAFFEAIQRIPIIFEDKFLGLQLGTTPATGIATSTFYAYIIIMLIIAGTTYFSFKINSTANMEDPSMKMMPYMMTIMIIITALFMPSGLGIYWATSNIFTIVQNILIKRSSELYGKA